MSNNKYLIIKEESSNREMKEQARLNLLRVMLNEIGYLITQSIDFKIYSNLIQIKIQQ